MNRQKLILSILLVLLAASLVYSYLRMPRERRATTTTPPPPRAAAKKAEPKSAPAASPKVVDDKKLHLELLDATPPKFAGFRKNIFKPLFQEEAKSAPPPLPAPPTRLPKPPPAPPSPPPVAKPPEAPQPTPVQQEMAKFTFLGFLKKDGKKTIFLSSNNEVFLVKKGDKIAGKYEVSNITDEALTISVFPDGGEIIIPLVENKPLSAPRR